MAHLKVNPHQLLNCRRVHFVAQLYKRCCPPPLPYSLYSVSCKVYQRLIFAFEKGDMEAARLEQVDHMHTLCETS